LSWKRVEKRPFSSMGQSLADGNSSSKRPAPKNSAMTAAAVIAEEIIGNTVETIVAGLRDRIDIEGCVGTALGRGESFRTLFPLYPSITI